MSQKPSDAWALPLSAGCHFHQHSVGETQFWKDRKRNPHKLAIEFARQSPDLKVREFAKTMIDRW